MSFVNIIPQVKDSLDKEMVKKVEHFFEKINHRLLYKMGVFEDYDHGGDDALGMEVEYFHFNITGDDRMRYLGQNIVLESETKLSPRNKLCNAIIAHLYGGRSIHSLLSGKTNPKEAYLDFERINSDSKYVDEIKANAAYAKAHGYKFYGTTELHTSLMQAGRDFCRKKYSEPERVATNTDIVEWVAGFIQDGLVDDLLYNTKTLSEAYEKINSLRGVGPYYGYHLAVDCSLIPGTPYHHDEEFCVPGPGARHTMDLLFPTLKEKVKKMPYGELIVWIEQNQKKLYPRIEFNDALKNIINEESKIKMFNFDQDKFMVYGLEVGHCQAGIYDYLLKNPRLIDKRKCGSDPDLTPLILREQGNPIEPVSTLKKKRAAKIVVPDKTILLPQEKQKEELKQQQKKKSVSNLIIF